MIGRRRLLTGAIGASQAALLGRFAFWSTPAHAGTNSGFPTKLLSIFVPGGLSHELMWAPVRDADVPLYVPRRDEGGFGPEDYTNFDGSQDADAEADVRRLRGPATWNWADPSEGHPNYNSNGYAWASPDFQLYNRTAVIHGVDQGTASHPSGVVAAMCGVAGANYAAPALPAVVANYFASRFPERAVPSVVLRGGPRAPGLDLPALSNPTVLSTVADLRYSLSEDHGAWTGFRTRTDVPEFGFDGTQLEGSLPLSIVDQAVLEATQRLRGRSSSQTDVFLETLYDQYKLLSKTLAAEVTSVIEGQTGVEHLPSSMPWAPGESRFGWRLGAADEVVSDATYIDGFDLALRLLKSDVCSAVTLKIPTLVSLDNHSSPFSIHNDYLRGAMDVVGRLLIEMDLTPCPSDSSKSLLDETLVYVFSDFGRSFMPAGNGGSGSDHNPMTSAVLVGGSVNGNQMVGGYRDGNRSGEPIPMLDDAGDAVTVAPRAQDVAATVLAGMGMIPNEDYFIPGGFHTVEGIVPT